MPRAQPPAIDPQQVDVLRVDHHLAPVAPERLAPAALRARFAQPPAWQPELVVEKKFMDRPPMPAAVLVAIVVHAAPTVLLTQRTQHLSTHSGQIAFAGGKMDPTDANAAAAALREAHEEVGLEPQHVEVLGELPIYTTGSSFLITPVVALVQPGCRLQPNPHEVQEVFEIPLAYLMNPANHRHHQLYWQGAERHWLSMPYQDGAVERFVWGATAGMLRNLYRFLSA